MEISVRKPTMFRFKADLIERLREAAKRENRSLNNYVECLLIEAMYHEPNALTKTAIDDVRHGEYAGTVDMSSLESMIKSIEE